MTTVNQYGENPWIPAEQQDTFIPDQLIAGPLQLVTKNVTIATGASATYARGTVLGMITASGKFTKSVATATDGSQVPQAILADAVDASSADQLAGVYLMGEFNQNRLAYDATWTTSTLALALRPYSIFLKDSIQAPSS